MHANLPQFEAVSESERMYDFALEKISSEIQTENVTCGHITLCIQPLLLAGDLQCVLEGIVLQLLLHVLRGV